MEQSWNQTCIELEQHNKEICLINETNPKDQTPKQKQDLADLRIKCIKLGYERYSILQGK